MFEAITVFFKLFSISPSFQLSLVNFSCLLCVVSFSVIPRLLRYSLRLRTRHITSRVSCVLHFSSFQHTFYFVLLSPSFRTFVGPVFSNIAPATLLSTISYHNKPQHLFNSFTVSKIYLYTMGYLFGSIRLLSLASSGLLTVASCPRFLFTIYDF